MASPRWRRESTGSAWHSAPVAHTQCVNSMVSPESRSSESLSILRTVAPFTTQIFRSSSRFRSAFRLSGVSSGKSLSKEFSIVTETFDSPTIGFHLPSTPMANSIPAAPPPTTTTFSVGWLLFSFSTLVATSIRLTNSEIGRVGIVCSLAPGTSFNPRLVEPISIETASKDSRRPPLVMTALASTSISTTRSLTKSILAHSASDSRSTRASGDE
mmetsp:Transcript_3194/g.6644  ORF Transcript_3194/g.6644 Transcript_3194/m.6644 type:complete len:214 (+) Transcript_3194:1821-2462(+)